MTTSKIHVLAAQFLRWMIGISIVNALIGALAVTVFVIEDSPAKAFRNAAVMIGIGLAGSIYFTRLLHRVQRLPTHS